MHVFFSDTEPTAEPYDETTLDATTRSPTTMPTDEVSTTDYTTTTDPPTTTRPDPKAADVVGLTEPSPTDPAPVCSPIAPVAAVPSAKPEKPSNQVDITMCREFAPSYYYCETPEALYVVQMVG